jgi:hypothetical protein
MLLLCLCFRLLLGLLIGDCLAAVTANRACDCARARGTGDGANRRTERRTSGAAVGLGLGRRWIGGVAARLIPVRC